MQHSLAVDRQTRGQRFAQKKRRRAKSPDSDFNISIGILRYELNEE